MTLLQIICVAVLAVVQTLASYISRIYSEFGKILSREVQENLDAWEERIEPHLGLSREHAALCAAVLVQLSLGLIALEFGAILFRPRRASRASRTRRRLRRRFSAWCWWSSSRTSSFRRCSSTARAGCGRRDCFGPSVCCCGWRRRSRSSSASSFPSQSWPRRPPIPREPAPDVEALIEAGEEEGILEQSDRELVRSAVEFGDMLVREVMTPRPEIFAVSESITLERFLELLKQHNYSRVPVYSGSLDNIKGLAFAHDLLQIADEDARTRTVATILRSAAVRA